MGTDRVDTVSNRSIEYAEQKLGVHSQNNEAREYLALLDSVIALLIEARSTRRGIEDQLADLEIDIQVDETSRHPSTSATALKEHLKVAIRKHEGHANLRSSLLAAQNQVDRLELDRSRIENHLKVSVARLAELGGYLQYLAAIKLAAVGTTSATPTTPAEGERA